MLQSPAHLASAAGPLTNIWLACMSRWDPAKVLIDPYAPLIKGRACFGVRDEFERFQEKACPTLDKNALEK